MLLRELTVLHVCMYHCISRLHKDNQTTNITPTNSSKDKPESITPTAYTKTNYYMLCLYTELHKDIQFYHITTLLSNVIDL